MEKQWKTRQNENGEIVKFWDQYTYLGKTYIMEELDYKRGEAVSELLLDLDIDNLRSVSDLFKINPGKILSSLIKNKTMPNLLAILLQEIDDSGVRAPAKPDDFRRGLLRTFKPLAVEVFADFFTLNEELYSGIASFVREIKGYVDMVKPQVTTARNQLMNSISSQAAAPKQ